MELIIESDDGRVLGSRDLDGSRWEQVGDHFENLQVVAVDITAAGTFGEMYIKNGNQRIGGEHYRVGSRLDIGGAIIMPINNLKLGYHEQHTQVWGDKARDHGVSGSQIEFSRGAAEQLTTMVYAAGLLINGNRDDVTAEIAIAMIEKLVVAADDLLAALKVAGTPV